MTEPAVPASPGTPPAEVDLDDRLVRALLRDQHPDLADRPLALVAGGWDNATYRLGDDLAVRLPRRRVAAALLRKEQEWLPRLAARLPVPVPEPVRVGEPSAGYPWPWSVVRWIPGRSAECEELSPGQAEQFGRFLAALHEPAPDSLPRNEYRCLTLADVSPRVEQRLRRLSTMNTGLAVPLLTVRQRWQQALAASPDSLDTCVHGDLHPKNLVVDAGRLAAVLDWGDLTAGDPAIDLAAAWMLFPVDAHPAVWESYRPTEPDTVVRAAGWAVYWGVTLLDAGLAGDPPFAEIGRRTLARLCGD
ncbi:MAG TPA: aminoglycoside phosphotransferase family protein [Natronosporangium sp.]